MALGKSLNQMAPLERTIVSLLRRRILTVVSLGLLSFFAGTLTAAAPVDNVIPIAKARSLPLGTHVTIDGIVSTPAGAFESSFDDKGFGLQDSSGGIYISTPGNPNVATPPRRARVSGVLTDKAGLLVVIPADATEVKMAPLKNAGDFSVIEPKALKTVEVGEANEGRIVRVHGKSHPGTGRRWALWLQVLRQRWFRRNPDLRQRANWYLHEQPCCGERGKRNRL